MRRLAAPWRQAILRALSKNNSGKTPLAALAAYNAGYMKLQASIAFSLLMLSVGNSVADCGVIRFAYPDQHRPPYWLGNGEAVPEPAGAGVDFVREFAASADCSLALMRLPVMRLRPSLATGAVDFTPVDVSAAGQPGIVIPRDGQGKPDIKRGTSSVVVVFVRAKDGIRRDMDPFEFVKGRPVGVTHGTTYAAKLEQAGARLDHGAATASANLEKLRLGRVDAVVISLISPSDMDKFVARRFGADLVRLEKPAMRLHMWLGVNQDYYDSHRAQVESMWNWIRNDGNRRYNSILRKYTEQ